MRTNPDRVTDRSRKGADQRRGAVASDLGQTAIVAVLAVTLIIGIIGATLVAAVVRSAPLQQTIAVSVYAHRALQAGENAYLTAVNANPSLAQCNVNTNNSGTCNGIDYGQWNLVNGSDASNSYAEYYAFGNPQPTFDPTTHALSNLAVQVVGAAHSQSTTNHYYFNSETMNLSATNGFLTNVWWSNYESYDVSGTYQYPNGTACPYNWQRVTASNGVPAKAAYTPSPCTGTYNGNTSTYACDYQVPSSTTMCPVYFGPGDYLFGPVFTNDSIYVSGDGTASGSPSFGNPSASPTVPSDVHTADPGCQFVDDGDGMNGSAGNCNSPAGAVGNVYLYATPSTTGSAGSPPHSTYGHAVELPPKSNAQLGTIAAQNGCLYSGPTQISLTKDSSGTGKMTVISPDTNESVVTVNGNTIHRTDGSAGSNNNDCPNDGTSVDLPANGVVYVQDAPAADTVTGANPFDDLVNNSVTNLTANPAPQQGQWVTLTARVTSATAQIPRNATVTFSQTTSQTTTQCNWWGWCRTVTQNSTDPIPTCTGLSTWSVPVQVGAYWQATVTCHTQESTSGTGAFSAAYSGGDGTSASQGNLGQTNTLRPSVSYGADSQTNTGGCSDCYFGETGTPDSEGDAFVHGNLSGSLTIGTQSNVIIDGNLTYADCNWTTGQSGATDFCKYNISGTNDSLGLIANSYVEVNHPVSKSNTSHVLPSCGGSPGALCDPSTSGSGVTIDAAVLALTKSFAVNNSRAGSNEGKLNVYGSIQQNARGPVGTFDPYAYAAASGYTKHYTWNPLLDFVSPPSYLVPSTAPWTLTAVDANGGQRGTNVCPVLTGVYDGTSSPSPITQSCSQATGGLPGYPALTAPSPPTHVYATANTGGVASVNWTDPSDNGSPILRYDVAPSPACTTCSGTEVTGATATSASVGGLTPGVSYIFTVTATNAFGTSDPSAPSASVTAPNVPYAPTLVTATGNANDSVTVSWTDPASPGGPISNYTVTPSPACPACSGLTVTGATATSATVTGLTVGGTYTFTVTATNGIGTGPPSIPSNAVVVPTKPGPPVGVTGTSYASGQSVVSWSVPPFTGGLPITGYRVTSSPGGKFCTPSGANTSCTVTGLTNGTAYTFTVTATNALGTGPASAPSPPATPSTTPGAPTIGTATAGNGSATVRFTAPASNGGAPMTGYTVTSSPGGITATCASSPCTVTGLTNGTAYTFKVTATNGAGSGPASASSNSVTPSGPPGPPQGVAATSYANGQSVVTWTAPATNGGSAITRYTVTSSGGQTCTTPNGSTTTCTVTGLTNGTTYTFTVTATNGLGTGPASAPATATPATAPGAPTGATAVRGYQQATVSWTAPAATGGLPVTSYTVTSAPGGRTCATSTTSCTVTGLTNNTSYTFTVTATNAAGTGPASAASNSVTPSNTVPGAPTNVAASSFVNTKSVVTWTAAAANGSTITKYTVTSSGGQTCTTTGATSCTVTGLTNGTSYTFTVTATNGLGTGPASTPSAPATPSTVPGAPSGVVASSFGNARSTVSWTAPASNGGAAITSYAVTSSGGQTCTTPNGSTTSCTVTGLTNGTSYTFTVTATNAVGTGPPSSPSAPIVPASVPGAPTGVTGTTHVDSQSVVSWTPPASNGGTSITGYTATSSPGGLTCSTSATSCTVTGLTDGTSYTFTVTATNAVGTGPPSSPSAPIVPATIPGAPTAVTATSFANTRSTVSWSPPTSTGGLALSSYTVTANSGQTCTTANSSTTSCTFLGLTNGTAYSFTVTATNPIGTGPASAPATGTPSTVPGAPTGVSATGGGGTQSTVSWTAPVSNGGAAITKYTVTSSGGQTCTTPNGSTTSCTVAGLTTGTPYTFTVTATNASGTGAASAPSSSVTPARSAGRPGAPSAPVVAATSSATSAVATWTAPAFDGGSPITGYVVTAAPGGPTCTTSTTSCTVRGLTAGTTYTFTVTATNGVGAGTASGASLALLAGTPGAPTSVRSGGGGNTQAVVSWTAPTADGGSPVSDYTVTSSPGGLSCSTSTTSCTVTGLTNGSSYTFTVTAANTVGTGPSSGPSAPVVPATAPGAPTSVTATSNADGRSVVSWTAPASTGGVAITGYTVRAVPGGATCVTASTSCTVTGLSNGTAYNFTVTATNSAGTGPASDPAATATPAVLPGTPTSVTATSNADRASVVSWTAPASDGGAPVTGYTVTASPGGATCTTASTSCTVTGLVNATPYTFTVTATNAVGTGPVSGPTPPAVPAAVPGAPTGASAVTTTSASAATVTWTAPTADGGAAVSSYTVTAAPGGATCFTNSTTCTLTGLTPGSAASFTVTATNSAGTGPASAPTGTVTVGAPWAPRAVSATSDADSRSVVSWTAPAVAGGSAVTGYTVTSSPAVPTPAACSTSLTGTSTGCTFTGLTNGTRYTFTVTATNALGSGPASAPSGTVVPAAAPGAPGGVTATSDANAQSVVTWAAPTTDGGAPISGYTVTSSPGGITCTSASTTCTVTGLTNGTPYTFTVTATNSAGTGAASAPSASATPATVPDSPTDVTATATTTATAAAVSWTAPGSDGGAAVSGYTVTSSPAVPTPAACSTSLTGTSTGCTFSGLAPGVAYTFTVTATNRVGTGPASATTASLLTGTAAAPSAVAAVATSSSTTAALSWVPDAADGGSAVTGYTVTSSPAVPTPAACSTSLSGTSTGCTFTGLTKGTTYTFTVSAVNAVGTGLASPATAPLLAGAPGAPTGVTGTAGGGSRSVVSWVAPSADGGSPVTGYTVSSTPGGPTCTSSTPACTVTGLVAGTIYRFTVTAGNAAGSGPASVRSAPVTP